MGTLLRPQQAINAVFLDNYNQKRAFMSGNFGLIENLGRSETERAAKPAAPSSINSPYRRSSLIVLGSQQHRPPADRDEQVIPDRFDLRQHVTSEYVGQR